MNNFDDTKDLGCENMDRNFVKGSKNSRLIGRINTERTYYNGECYNSWCYESSDYIDDIASYVADYIWS